MNKSNAIAAVGPAYSESPGVNSGRNALASNRRHRIPSAPRSAVPGRCAAPALPSGYAAATPGTRRASLDNRKWPALFDDLVGDREQSVRHVEAERFRGLEVDDKLVLDRLLDRQIG
jgi:hypothetical protein